MPRAAKPLEEGCAPCLPVRVSGFYGSGEPAGKEGEVDRHRVGLKGFWTALKNNYKAALVRLWGYIGFLDPSDELWFPCAATSSSRSQPSDPTSSRKALGLSAGRYPAQRSQNMSHGRCVGTFRYRTVPAQGKATSGSEQHVLIDTATIVVMQTGLLTAVRVQSIMLPPIPPTLKGSDSVRNESETGEAL